MFLHRVGQNYFVDTQETEFQGFPRGLFLDFAPPSLFSNIMFYSLPDEIQIKKPVPLVNGINSKTDIDTMFSNDTRNKKNQKSNENDEKSSSSLSLHDLETISSIPSKDSNVSKRHLNQHDNYESGFVRLTKLSSNFKSNGDVTGNKQQRSSKHNKQPKAPAESDYELDISDSEESTSSSRLSHDNSPKTHRSATIDNLQNKLKEEQVSRYFYIQNSFTLLY